MGVWIAFDLTTLDMLIFLFLLFFPVLLTVVNMIKVIKNNNKKLYEKVLIMELAIILIYGTSFFVAELLPSEIIDQNLSFFFLLFGFMPILIVLHIIILIILFFLYLIFKRTKKI